ncbi:MAG: hypothetical protein WKF75_10460 [Singulisphaera sp.]
MARRAGPPGGGVPVPPSMADTMPPDRQDEAHGHLGVISANAAGTGYLPPRPAGIGYWLEGTAQPPTTGAPRPSSCWDRASVDRRALRDRVRPVEEEYRWFLGGRCRCGTTGGS